MSQPVFWNNERILKLIKLYRTYECLWVPSNDKFRCRNTRKKACRIISKALEVDITEVKRKMKVLIAHFHMELEFVKVAKFSRWFAYHHMLFLQNENNNYSDDDVTGTSGCTEETFESETSRKTGDISEEGSTKDAVVTIDIHGREVSAEPPDSHQSIPGTSTGYTGYGQNESSPPFDTRRRTPQEFRHPQTKSLSNEKHETKQGINDSVMQDEHYRDKFTIFGEHVACKIRKLHTEHARNTVKHIICNALWEASLGRYDHPSPGSLC